MTAITMTDRNLAIGLRYDDPILDTIDFRNAWPLLDSNLVVVGIVDEDTTFNFQTGSVRDGRFVADEDDPMFAGTEVL